MKNFVTVTEVTSNWKLNEFGQRNEGGEVLVNCMCEWNLYMMNSFFTKTKSQK